MMRSWLVTGAVLGLTGVALGSFGAHGLERALASSGLDAEAIAGQLDDWDVAVRYQLFHALALLVVGGLALRARSRLLDAAAVAFSAGVVLFSGCLYAYVLTGERTLALIVPAGGSLLLLGWLLMAVAASRLGGGDNR